MRLEIVSPKAIAQCMPVNVEVDVINDSGETVSGKLAVWVGAKSASTDVEVPPYTKKRYRFEKVARVTPPRMGVVSIKAKLNDVETSKDVPILPMESSILALFGTGMALSMLGAFLPEQYRNMANQMVMFSMFAGAVQYMSCM